MTADAPVVPAPELPDVPGLPGLPGLVRRARDLTARRPGRRTVLGLTGAPGSGKSTLAAALVAALAAEGEAVVVPMDGFHLAGAELLRLGRRERKGAPDTFDAAGYAALLARLREASGDVVYAPAFDRRLEEPVAGSIPVPPGVGLVVTEGNYLLLEDGAWGRVRAHLDEVWFLEVDDERRLERLAARHARHGKSPEEARAWARGSDERNAAVVRATRERADLVVELS